MPSQKDRPPIDIVIAALAARQHGVVALWQLRRLGLAASSVRDRAAAGRLHRVHRGVYAVGHPLVSRRGRYMAAVLACGPCAVLSHRSAADLHGLRPDNGARIDVTKPCNSGTPHPGLRMHRCRTTPSDVTEEDDIPCTSVARTLLDLASTDVPQAQVDKAVDRAVTLQTFDLGEVEDALARGNGRRGVARLRKAIVGHEDTRAREGIEQRFLRLVKTARLPLPQVNQWLGDKEVDFVWPGRRLIVETDGYADHGGPHAFRADRRRDRELQLQGWRVIRFTWADDPGEVVRTLQAFLR